MIEEGLNLIQQQISTKGKQYIGKDHYLTTQGRLRWGNEYFYFTKGIVINTNNSYKAQNQQQWRIVAYHGTQWRNLQSILQLGLIPGDPINCLTFNGALHGKGVYCSPYQSYAKLYNKGGTKVIQNKRVRLVLGLRIRNSAAIEKTIDDKIWIIKNKEDVSIQDINLTIDQ